MDKRRARSGALLIIGGHEDRENGGDVLTRFVDLCGGAEASIVVLTAASTVPEKVWPPYENAFSALGVTRCTHVYAGSREEAHDAALVRAVREADGIFIAGGDQKRLLANLGGTPLEQAMHAARAGHGACVAGTSAGASAMSAVMLAEGRTELLPEKGAIGLGAGFGMLQRVVIDQHFSERRRLARLLSVVAQNPQLYGIGIDENTALLVTPGAGVEVIGEGAVTVIDARAMVSNVAEIRKHHTPEMIGVQLHLLPSGSAYRPDEAPPVLQDFLQTLTTRNTVP